MDGAVSFLILCNILVPAVFVVRGCLSKRGIEVNHILLFSLGFVYYWILPIVVGFTGLYQASEDMGLWYSIFDDIPNSILVSYLAVCLGSYLSFGFGSVLGERIFAKETTKYKILFFDRRLLNLYLFLGMLVSGIFVVALRDKLFKGYTVYEADDLRGSFGAVGVFMLSLMFVYNAKLEERYHALLGFAKVLLNRFFIAYFIVAVLVFSTGGRLFFLSSILMLLVYRSVYFQRMRLRTFLFFLIIAGALSGFVGLVRRGDRIVDVVNAYDLVFNIFSEPLYTAFSLIAFLRDHSLEAIHFPKFLLSGFINLVPSVVLPLKAEMIASPEAYGYTVFAPGGALSSFFSFMINFGVIGTQVFLFLFSFFLSFLKTRSKMPLFKVMYIMISGWLAFSLFRESFQQSIVKEIFEFSILTPAVVVLSLHFLSVAFRGRARERKLESEMAKRIA